MCRRYYAGEICTQTNMLPSRHASVPTRAPRLFKVEGHEPLLGIWHRRLCHGAGGISSQIKLITGPRNVTNWKSVFKSEHRHRLWTSSSAFRRIQVKALLIVTVWLQHVVNPLSAHENRRATDHFTAIRWSLHWVGCYIWYSEEGTARGRSPPRPLLAIRNVTAHPSTVSVPTFIRCGTIVASVP